MLGALNVSLAMVSLAFVQCFGTISLVDIGLDENQTSWFVSIDMMLAFMVAPMGGKLAELIGIKRTFLVCSPILILGFICIGTNLSTFVLFLGRILNGIGVSCLMVQPSVYIAETVHPDGRTTMASLIGFSASFGICVLTILGYFFHWETVAFLSTIPSIIAFTGFIFLPESPYWLIHQQQKFEKAFTALKYYRKNREEDEVIEEFKEILEHYQQRTEKSKENFINRLCSPSFRKPFMCIGILYPLYESTSSVVSLNYLQSLMIESNIQLDTNSCSLILGLARIVSAILTLAKMQRLPPRSTFVVLATIKTICLAIIGGFYYFQGRYPGNENGTWIPLVMFIVAFFCRAFIVTLLWTLVGEMFPSELRNLASGIIDCLVYIVIFLFLNLYSSMKHSLGLHGVFFLYAGCGALVTIYGALTIPDNRSKSLVEIENNNCKRPLIPKK